jgi:hypothetical protein
VKDAYHGLKGLIQRRFADKPDAEAALTQAEKKPKVWEEPLKDALKEQMRIRTKKSSKRPRN